MNGTRYCSTCGTLLREDAVICGECGARYQASPYERRATDAPGAWSPPPRHRSRDLGTAPDAQDEDGIEILTRDDLVPRPPGATAPRTPAQYDQGMVTQPPMHQNGPVASPGMAPGPGSPGSAPQPQAPAGAQPLDPPLDGCVPGTPVARLLAALVDGVLATLMTIPFLVGIILVIRTGEGGALPLTLVGVGVVLPLAYALVMIWLSGAKGFTLGKLALGLRITRYSAGGPLGFVRALGRWVVYGVIWPVMALSIFLDPKKQLRGFHDRAVDSIVVSAKAGRNPMRPRADDFEREGAEHYLGASSVPVSAHENLLSRPGAAWSAEEAQEPAASQAPASAEAPLGAPSPYAPPAAQAPEQGGWPSPSAPPQHDWSAPQQPAQSAPSAPQQTDWSAPSAPQQDGWSAPPVPSASEQPGGAAPSAPVQDGWSAPQDPAAQASADQGWAPPAPAQSWDAPQPAQTWDAAPQSAQDPAGDDAAQGGWAPPVAPAPQHEDAPAPERRPWDPPTGMQHPAPAPEPPVAPAPEPPVAPAPMPQAQQPAPAEEPAASAPAPNELTGDAWDGADSEVDEQTRLTAAPQDLGDLEQTRLSPAHLPVVPTHRLTLDDGAERVVDGAVVIGRNPVSADGELLFVLKDETRSVSKTHLRLDGTGDEVVVTDLGSTNGSTILREDGSREELTPDTPTVLPAGAQVTLGDRTLSVVREK